MLRWISRAILLVSIVTIVLVIVNPSLISRLKLLATTSEPNQPEAPVQDPSNSIAETESPTIIAESTEPEASEFPESTPDPVTLSDSPEQSPKATPMDIKLERSESNIVADGQDYTVSTQNEDDASVDLKNPLTRSLSGLLDSFKDSLGDSSPDFKEDLIIADTELTRSKLVNRKAIAEVNRQVRIAGASSPNILLIAVDGLTIDQLGCYGNSEANTPNIDALAKQGTRFTQFYAGLNKQTAEAKLLTGKSNLERAKNAKALLTRVMWDAGYSTAFIGDGYQSLTLGLSKFDHFFGEDTPPKTSVPALPLEIYSGDSKVRLLANNNSTPEDDVTWSKLYKNELDNYLTQRKKRRPFFVSIHLKSDYFQDHGNKSNNIDTFIGTVIKALDDNKYRRNTIVILTSFNNAESADLTENDLKAPLIISGNSRWKVEQTDYIAGMQDLMPTILDTVKATRRPSSDGRSLTSVLNGTYRKTNKERVFRFAHPEQPELTSVRIGEWKAIFGQEVSLYNLEKDPEETSNIALQQPSIVRQLKEHGKIETSN